MAENIGIPEVQAPKMGGGGAKQDPRMTPRGSWGKMPAERVISATRELLHEQEKVAIMIPSTERDKMDVTVQVNGHNYVIQRDKKVEVPLSVVRVLEDAKMTTYTQRARESGEGNQLVPQEVLRIPFQRF